jgi:hypothetical protein
MPIAAKPLDGGVHLDVVSRFAVVLGDRLGVAGANRPVAPNAQRGEDRVATPVRSSRYSSEYPADPVPEKHARSDAGGFLHLLAEFLVRDGAVIRFRHPFQDRDGGRSPFGKSVRESDRRFVALAISA